MTTHGTTNGTTTATPGDGPGDAAPAASPWRDILLSPLRGGALGGFLALGSLLVWSGRLEGGIGDEPLRLFLRPVVAIAAAGVAAIYARRIALCAYEDDRPVPWVTDERDVATAPQIIGAFCITILLALGPALVLGAGVSALGAPVWLVWGAAAAALGVATIHLPFAIASSVIRQGALGAGYGGTLRAWRANRSAARIAIWPSAAFLGLLVLSVALAAWLVPHIGEGRPATDLTTARETGRWIVGGVRLAAGFAAFCSFRVAGLLARDVPEIRAVLA